MKDVVSMNGNLQEVLGPPTANSPLWKGFKENIKKLILPPIRLDSCEKTDL